jgi:hypothetical protein
MAIFSGGVWSDSEISTLSPTATGDYQIGAISCPSPCSCEVGVVPPGATEGGFVPFQSGVWGSLQPAGMAPSASAPGSDPVQLIPSLSCVSMTDCIAAIGYASDTGLQSFDGSSWSSVAGSPVSNETVPPEWLSVSCPAANSCLADFASGYSVQPQAQPTRTTMSVRQVGMLEVHLTATVGWTQFGPPSQSPTVTFYNDNQPIGGCGAMRVAGTTSPSATPVCDIVFAKPGPYSFSAKTNSNSFFVGSTSPSSTGNLALAYWEIGRNGTVYPFGDAAFYGSANPGAASSVVGIAATADDRGYWTVTDKGMVDRFGDAKALGDLRNDRLNLPIVGMAATPDGGGYWLVASDGGIFAFGNARFYGSTGSVRLNKPVVGMAATPNGAGYWLVASDGGIFTFGNAPFEGSTGSQSIPSPVSSIQGG